MKRFLLLVSALYISSTVFSEIVSPQDSLFRELEATPIPQPISTAFLPDTIIKISTQEAFNRINQSINSAIDKKKKGISVVITPGVYEFFEKHIDISRNLPNVNISIVGVGATIKGKGSIIKAGGTINPEYAYYYQGHAVDLWEDVKQSEDLVEVVDLASKLCRIRVNSTEGISPNSYIQISQWYYSKTYPVKYAENGYVYFTVDNLAWKDSYQSYNINFDYYYSQETPRYRIWKGISNYDLEESHAINFITISASKFKTLKLSGLNFEGCAYSTWQTLIAIGNTQAEQVEISSCTFKACKSTIILFGKTNNTYCHNNTFYDNYQSCISSKNGCNNTIITYNKIDRNDKAWNNVFAINCQGRNFHVANNTITDFGYGAITIGMSYANSKDYPVTGIVEKNKLYFNQEYLNKYKQHTLMDAGAIYVATQNDRVVVRYNDIHDYTGMKDNRGIFCDDGTCNAHIYGNFITNIFNSYSIDLRSVRSIENNPASNTNISNVGNSIMYNVIDSPIRFHGRKGADNECIQGKNFILTDSYSTAPTCVYSSLPTSEADTFVIIKSKARKIRINKSDYKTLKSSPIWKIFKNKIRK